MNPKVLRSLIKIFGSKNIIQDSKTSKEKSSDLCPANLFHGRSDSSPVIIKPQSIDVNNKLSDLVKLALDCEPKLEIITRGGGSGVCGAANVTKEEIVLDMTDVRNVHIVSRPKSNEEGLLIVSAGSTGHDIDKAIKSLNPLFTCGHYPASYFISTAGGWVNTNASGQFSFRFGKIGDLVSSVKGIDGKSNIIFLNQENLNKVIGMEGTSSILSSVYLPIFKKPENNKFIALNFRNVKNVKDFLKWIHKEQDRFLNMGGEIYAVRFYDWVDYKFIGRPHKGVTGSENRLKYFGEKYLCSLKSRLGSLVFLLEKYNIMPWTGIIYLVSDSKDSLIKSANIIEDAAKSLEGSVLDSSIAENWYVNRFKLGYDKLLNRFKIGLIVDTFDCKPEWENLIPIYEKIRKILFNFGIVGAHLGLDRQGPYIYFTFALSETNLYLYKEVWEKILESCVSAKIKTNHHHGIGKLKAGDNNRFAPYGYGQEWFDRAIKFKREMDPHNILNPANLFKI